MPQRKVLGIIPAKGGSTRLAQKNVRLLGGKPLIGWAADVARASGCVDRLVLSTEDLSIAEKARALGIEVPFMRPAHLARDPAGIVDVCLHVIEELEKSGEHYDDLIILPPTCPLRNADDVIEAYRLFRERDGKFLMSVTLYDHTPFAALLLDDEGCLEPAFPQYSGRKSQEMPKAFRPNGAIHILDVAAFKMTRSYYAKPLLAYVMPRERSVDIDHQEDLDYAETLLKRQIGLLRKQDEL